MRVRNNRKPSHSNLSNAIYCYECDTIFPYKNISNDEFCFLNSTSDLRKTDFELYMKCKEFEFQSTNIKNLINVTLI